MIDLSHHIHLRSIHSIYLRVDSQYVSPLSHSWSSAPLIAFTHNIYLRVERIHHSFTSPPHLICNSRVPSPPNTYFYRDAHFHFRYLWHVFTRRTYPSSIQIYVLTSHPSHNLPGSSSPILNTTYPSTLAHSLLFMHHLSPSPPFPFTVHHKVVHIITSVAHRRWSIPLSYICARHLFRCNTLTHISPILPFFHYLWQASTHRSLMTNISTLHILSIIWILRHAFTRWTYSSLTFFTPSHVTYPGRIEYTYHESCSQWWSFSHLTCVSGLFILQVSCLNILAFRTHLPIKSDFPMFSSIPNPPTISLLYQPHRHIHIIDHTHVSNLLGPSYWHLHWFSPI